MEAFEGLLVGPGFDGQIRLGVEADAEDDDGDETGDVAGKLPVFPFARLARWRWGPVEEVALGPLFVARGGPAAGAGVAAASAEGGEEATAEHGGGGGERRRDRHG